MHPPFCFVFLFFFFVFTYTDRRIANYGNSDMVQPQKHGSEKEDTRCLIRLEL